jgi:hypothetical protein
LHQEIIETMQDSKRPMVPTSVNARSTWVKAAHTHIKMRHSPEAESALFQKRQQFVVGLKAFGSSFNGIGLGQSLFLQREVGIQVDQM